MADIKHPAEWEVKDLMAVGTAGVALVCWIWRNALKSLTAWVMNALKAPWRINELFKCMERLESDICLSTHRGRALYRLVSYPIWESDANGLCVYCNPAMLRVLRCEFMDVAGDNWRSRILPEDRHLVFEEWDSAVNDGRDFNLSYHWISTMGEVIPVTVTTTILRDGKGDIMGSIAFVNDQLLHHRQGDFKAPAP